MFHSRKLKNWINHIHERVLRFVYKDYTSSFDELLLKYNFFRIHHRNLQKLAIQILKVKLGLAREIMKNIFPIIENPYDLRNETKFKSRMSELFDMALKLLLLLHQEFGAAFQEVTKNVVLLTNLKQKLNLPLQTLQKLHLSNRLYIEQVTCHLLTLLLSARACSDTAKRNSVCLEIPFGRGSSLMETSQLICVANRLTGFFVICEVRGFCMISGWGIFRWAHGFC